MWIYFLTLCSLPAVSSELQGVPQALAKNQTSRTGRDIIDPTYPLGVVFRIRDGEKKLVGTIVKPRIEGTSVKTVQPRQSKSHELWLLNNGVTRGLWLNAHNGVFGSVQPDGTHGDTVGIDRSLANLVITATPVRSIRSVRPMTRSTALVVEPPKTLAALCAGAQVIAKGTVVWILRNEHTPINSPYAPQHTVYIFAVEQYLKSTSKSGPAVLKVIVPGGQLPYIEVTGAPGGIGWELEESPMLDIGSRYCLFLDRPQDSSPTFQRLGFVPAGAHNRYGKHAELDEYRVREMWRGKLLLRDGIARPARLTGVPLYDAWRFESGPQILNVPEDEAIRNIREAVTSERD